MFSTVIVIIYINVNYQNFVYVHCYFAPVVEEAGERGSGGLKGGSCRVVCGGGVTVPPGRR